MSTTGLDLPLLPNSEQIRRRMFARVRRGYDPDQVREYLSQIADQVENLEERVREARMASEASLSRPSDEPDPAGEMAERIADIVRTAERHAEERQRESEGEARTILADARAEADRVRLDAQAKAESARQQASEALTRAREEADHAVGHLAARREELVGQFEGMRERLLAIAGDLGSVVGPAAHAAEDPRTLGEEPLFSSDLAGPPEFDVSHEALWARGEPVDLHLPDLELDTSEDEE